MNYFSQFSMTDLSLNALITLAVSAAFSVILTPTIIHFALKTGVVAACDVRRRHEKATPLLGGISIYFGLMFACAFVAVLAVSNSAPRHIFDRIFWYAVPTTLIFMIGFLDDVKHLSARPKFFVQILAAALFLHGNSDLVSRFVTEPGLLPFAYLFLGFFIVAATNSFNLIDGMDGLCSSNAAICAISLVAIALLSGQVSFLSLFAAPALIGATAGFLLYNKRPAKIFLGDSGSLTLGFTLATIGVDLALRQPSWIGLGIPMFGLGLSLLDVTLVMLIRYRAGRPIFSGDRNHLHHRLQRLGLGHNKTLALMLAGSAYFNIQALSLLYNTEQGAAIRIFSMLAVTVLGLISLHLAENQLLIQTNRFGQASIAPSLPRVLTQPEILQAMEHWASERDAQSKSVSIMTINHLQIMPQLLHESPSVVDQFFRELYEMIHRKIRGEDLILRFSESLTVILFADTTEIEDDGRAPYIRITEQVKNLQIKFNIASSDHLMVEGVSLMLFPDNLVKISRTLSLPMGTLRRVFEPKTAAVTPIREELAGQLLN